MRAHRLWVLRGDHGGNDEGRLGVAGVPHLRVPCPIVNDDRRLLHVASFGRLLFSREKAVVKIGNSRECRFRVELYVHPCGDVSREDLCYLL